METVKLKFVPFALNESYSKNAYRNTEYIINIDMIDFIEIMIRFEMCACYVCILIQYEAFERRIDTVIKRFGDDIEGNLFC